jgi:hypothetical protein
MFSLLSRRRGRLPLILGSYCGEATGLPPPSTKFLGLGSRVTFTVAVERTNPRVLMRRRAADCGQYRKVPRPIAAVSALIQLSRDRTESGLDLSAQTLMTASEMPAAIRPYSMDVVPDSSFMKVRNVPITAPILLWFVSFRYSETNRIAAKSRWQLLSEPGWSSPRLVTAHSRKTTLLCGRSQPPRQTTVPLTTNPRIHNRNGQFSRPAQPRAYRMPPLSCIHTIAARATSQSLSTISPIVSYPDRPHRCGKASNSGS